MHNFDKLLHWNKPLDRMEDRGDMDLFSAVLCDELLTEIFGYVQDKPDRENISLVCKRWLSAEGKATKNLRLCIPGKGSVSPFCSSVHNLVRRYSQVVSLSVDLDEKHDNEELLEFVVFAVASSCHLLRNFRILSGRVSAAALNAIARGCPHLSSLHFVSFDTKTLPSFRKFETLRELSLNKCVAEEKIDHPHIVPGILPIQRLSLEGISLSNPGMDYLWSSLPRLERLELVECEAIFDSDTPFTHCLPSLQHLTLRRCRTIANLLLLMVAKFCKRLKALVFQDGGSTIGLHEIIRSCNSLELLELRLPIDLFDEDLAIVAQNGGSLKSLRLHSCWMATGAGLKLLGMQMRSNLEDLALIRCRAIVQDPGTLASLSQDLKSLKSVDLSENDRLSDKELVCMLTSSCQRLLHLRLRCCRKLTDKAMEFIGQKCQVLCSIVVTNCDGITSGGIMAVLEGCPSLIQVCVETHKITGPLQKLASERRILLPATERSIAGC